MLSGVEHQELTSSRFPPDSLVAPLIEHLPPLGLSEAERVPWSSPNRYDWLASWLLYGSTTDPHLQFLQKSLRSQRVLRIQECAVGEGQALEGFHAQLGRLPQKLEIWVHDLEDPAQLISADVLTRLRYDRGTKWVMQPKDVRVPPGKPDFFDLSILGYIHPYLSPVDFRVALQNQAAESRVTAIIPGIDEKRRVQAVALLYKDGHNQWRASQILAQERPHPSLEIR